MNNDNKTINGLKECVAAAISVAIVSFTIFFLARMFGAPADVSDTLWQHQSTILNAALALSGSVFGYYFGRLPAEKAAALAQETANNAQQQVTDATQTAERASAEAARIRTRVGELAKNVRTPLGGAATLGSGGGPDIRADIAKRLEDILQG